MPAGRWRGRWNLPRRTPSLKAVLFDLPAVAERAANGFRRAGLSDRVTAAGGDFLVNPLPDGADIVSLVRVLHDHDDGAVLAILRAARRALPADGTLLIAEPLAGTPGAEPVGDAYFGMYLLAMGRGRARTREELAELLRQAGFTRVRSVGTHVPLITSVIIAHPDVR
jgi:demethylspheroidene O-methyltransferase